MFSMKRIETSPNSMATSQHNRLYTAECRGSEGGVAKFQASPERLELAP